jgi:hypothetical protein
MSGMSEEGQEGQGQPIDDGAAIHYTAVPRGAPVYSSDGVEVGTVREMLDNSREHIFDGVIFADSGGRARFVDAPEVARTAERGVTLAIDAEQAAELGPPEAGQGAAGGSTGGGGGGLARIFGLGRRR